MQEHWAMSPAWIWWTLVFLLLIGGFWAMARRLDQDRDAPSETPEEILKRRYASGEIDTEEYEQRLAEFR